MLYLLSEYRKIMLQDFVKYYLIAKKQNNIEAMKIIKNVIISILDID